MNKYTLMAIFVSSCFYGGCAWVNNLFELAPDNEYEEFVERMLERELDLKNVDLTPDSPEKANDHSTCWGQHHM